VFKKILFIADNHKLMDSLLRYVPSLFPEAEYHVMGVVDYSPLFVSATDRVGETVECAVVEAVLKCRKVLTELGIECQSGVVWGDFAARVQKYTEEKGIDLIAVETFMDEDTKRSHLSWHVERLFRGTDRPILILDRLPATDRPKSLLVLLTDHPFSAGAALFGLELANHLKAACFVYDVGEKADSDIREKLRERAEVTGTELGYLVESGAPLDRIMDILSEHDMLVMTRGGITVRDKMRMTVSGLPISRKAYEVFARAPVPTLLVGSYEVEGDG